MSANDHLMSDRPRVLALDLEGTLISNAISQIPRPGLRAFLEWAAATFERLVLFTAVRPSRACAILQLLAAEGAAPPWLATLEIIDWSGTRKDLRHVPHIDHWRQVWLLDDIERYVVPDQRECWIPILPFDSPYPDDDAGLEAARGLMVGRLSQTPTPGLTATPCPFKKG